MINNNKEDDQSSDQNSQVVINIQYVKDLSFESPNAPMSLTSKEQPKVDIQLNIEVKPFEDNNFEVEISIKSSVKTENNTMFRVELAYAGLFTLVNIDKTRQEEVLFIYCPSLLFPFARRIIADATRDGGFQPLMIDPIDFAALYENRKKDFNNSTIN